MFKIPKIANVIPVNTSFARFNFSAGDPIDESVGFQFNIEAFITLACKFPYYVGEGPLYWYKIDWYPSVCPMPSCTSIAPAIEYLQPNCPYEIIQNCIIMPPECPCEPSCTPGECVTRTVEVWHMLATSVEHLCERINQECCSRKPPGFMRSVKQYMRPALCCDVEVNGPGTDNYEDVDFIKCECGNLVDPCIKRIIYPCHINRCGINGPAFEGPDPIPVETINFTTDLLGHNPVMFATSFDLGIMQPIELESPKKPAHRFGPTVPDIIHCSHNLGECNLFKDFLKRSKIQFNEIDLYYNNEYKTWQGTKNFKEWKFILEWIPSQASYNFNVFVENKNLKSKLFLIVKADGFLNDKNNFEIDLNFNTKNGKLKKQVLQSKIMHDDIGVFKNTWGNELKVNMRG
jgi:hypothetical protein